jgi:hypothetical protein
LGDKIVSGFFLAVALGAIKVDRCRLAAAAAAAARNTARKGIVCQLVSGISFVVRSACQGCSGQDTHIIDAFFFSLKGTKPTYLPPVSRADKKT